MSAPESCDALAVELKALELATQRKAELRAKSILMKGDDTVWMVAVSLPVMMVFGQISLYVVAYVGVALWGWFVEPVVKLGGDITASQVYGILLFVSFCSIYKTVKAYETHATWQPGSVVVERTITMQVLLIGLSGISYGIGGIAHWWLS